MEDLLAVFQVWQRKNWTKREDYRIRLFGDGSGSVEGPHPEKPREYRAVLSWGTGQTTTHIIKAIQQADQQRPHEQAIKNLETKLNDLADEVLELRRQMNKDKEAQ